MIADENIDIIYVASPNNTHYEYIKKALETGKNVFCEKSMTVNAKEFDELEALAKEKGVILTEGFTLYHMPIYDKVKELISSGKLGEIKLVQVNFGSLKDPDPTKRYFSKELAGGALLDIGVMQPHLPECSLMNSRIRLRRPSNFMKRALMSSRALF